MADYGIVTTYNEAGRRLLITANWNRSRRFWFARWETTIPFIQLILIVTLLTVSIDGTTGNLF